MQSPRKTQQAQVISWHYFDCVSSTCDWFSKQLVLDHGMDIHAVMRFQVYSMNMSLIQSLALLGARKLAVKSLRRSLEEQVTCAGAMEPTSNILHCRIYGGARAVNISLCLCLHPVVLTHSQQDCKKMLVQLLCASGS